MVKLSKGDSVSLKKGLDRVRLSLGWKSGLFKSIDCDSGVLVHHDNGRANFKRDMVYYGNLWYESGGIVHNGDNLVGGDGKGVNETIDIHLTFLPADVDKLVIVVNIYNAIEQHLNFGKIKRCFMFLTDINTGEELCSYDIAHDMPDAIFMTVGELVRTGSDVWDFRAIGEGSLHKSFMNYFDNYQITSAH